MANKPTVAWDETSPPGSQSILLGDNRIRELKTQIREVVDVDHDFPSSGQAETTGQHKQVTLQEAEDIGTGAEGVPILGAQTVGGKAELVFTDEDDNDIQMTKEGQMNAIMLSGTQTAEGVKTFSDVPVMSAGANMGNSQVTGMCIENRTDDTGCTQTGRIWLRTDL